MIMMNQDGFQAGALTRWYLGLIGAFPKKKGAQDFSAMRYTLGLLRRKIPVLIFPEGQTTWDGRTQPIYSGIERIVKKTGCPLVICRIEGNFLSKPWWAYRNRKGAVKMQRTVLTSSAIKKMDESAIRNAIIAGIRHDEFASETMKDIRFRGKNVAHGLEHFLWLCPWCKTEDRLTTHGEKVRCIACGKSMVMDPNCRLCSPDDGISVPAHVGEWADQHRAFVRERIAKTKGEEPLTQSENLLLQIRDETGVFRDRWRGTLALTPKRLSFVPANKSEGDALHWSVSALQNYVFQKKNILEITIADKDYRFVLEKGSPMKWLYYLRYCNNYQECESRGYQ
jgi:hypothetical protein